MLLCPVYCQSWISTNKPGNRLSGDQCLRIYPLAASGPKFCFAVHEKPLCSVAPIATVDVVSALRQKQVSLRAASLIFHAVSIVLSNNTDALHCTGSPCSLMRRKANRGDGPGEVERQNRQLKMQRRAVCRRACVKFAWHDGFETSGWNE